MGVMDSGLDAAHRPGTTAVGCLLFAMTTCDSAASRRECVRALPNNARPNRGRRECRVRAAPAVSRAKSKSTRGRHHRFTGAARHSPRNGFNGLLRDLPGDRALLSPSFSEYGWSAPGRADFASAKLDASVEASGPHDFTVRISAVRLRACKSLTGWTPPCDSRLRADAACVHRIPAQRP